MENRFFEKKKFYVEDKMIFYTGLIYFVVMLLFVGLKLCNYYGLLSFIDPKVLGELMSAVIQVGLMFVLPLLLFKFITKSSFKQTFNHFSF